MRDVVLAALKGGDSFAAAYGLSPDDARAALAQQWAELDRLAAADPTAYGRRLEATAREAGAQLPPGMAKRAATAAALPAPPAAAAQAGASAQQQHGAPPATAKLAALLDPAALLEARSGRPGQLASVRAAQPAALAGTAAAGVKPSAQAAARRPLIQEVTTVPRVQQGVPAAPVQQQQQQQQQQPSPVTADARLEEWGGHPPCVRVCLTGLPCGTTAARVKLQCEGQTVLVVRVDPPAGGDGVLVRVALPAPVDAAAGGARINPASGRLVVRLPCSSV